MASKLISFRISDDAVEALQAQTVGNESLNLVAQRLLSELLGVPTDSKPTGEFTSASVQSPVNSQQIIDDLVNNLANSQQVVDSLVNRIIANEMFTEALEKKLTPLVMSGNQRLTEAEERIEMLEKTRA